jgi:acetyl-CoA synthetase
MKNLKISSFEDYQSAYQQSVDDPALFWKNIAAEFSWYKQPNSILDWDFHSGTTNWFADGELNITVNALDRHLEKDASKVALIWESNEINEPSISYTYSQLHEKVCQFANVLRSKGVNAGDRVCIYMPMIPELTIAILACARIGAVHMVVFAGFSASALRDRMNDCLPKVIVTADGLRRGNKQINLKEIVDESLVDNTFVESVIVYRALELPIQFNASRDCWWHELIQSQPKTCEPAIMKAEDPLFILYTSGSTGKPKGVVHTTAGYMIYTAYTFLNVYQYEENDLFWCTADIGWITGHSYIIYGPLVCGATTLMFEGIPTYPDASRFWQIIEKHQVNQFLTAPTAIRSLMAYGNEYVETYEMNSLKAIGSVGEPINEEAWNWYHDFVGKKRCSVVDNWWQTETGGILISAIASISPLKPSYAGLPLPGVQPVLLDVNGNEIQEANVEGFLCIKFPWPSIIRTTFGDHERCRVNYFSQYPGYYFSGDGAKRDEQGMFRIIGRIDDVINVSGHRFGTAEIENAINIDESVIESAVVGFPHDNKGQAIYAFVVLENDLNVDTKQLIQNIHACVATAIGKIAIPDVIQVVSSLPKTRSGKIMRRILRKIAEGEIEQIGDTSTLLDPTVVTEIIEESKRLKNSR